MAQGCPMLLPVGLIHGFSLVQSQLTRCRSGLCAGRKAFGRMVRQQSAGGDSQRGSRRGLQLSDSLFPHAVSTQDYKARRLEAVWNRKVSTWRHRGVVTEEQPLTGGFAAGASRFLITCIACPSSPCLRLLRLPRNWICRSV